MVAGHADTHWSEHVGRHTLNLLSEGHAEGHTEAQVSAWVRQFIGGGSDRGQLIFVIDSGNASGNGSSAALVQLGGDALDRCLDDQLVLLRVAGVAISLLQRR